MPLFYSDQSSAFQTDCPGQPPAIKLPSEDTFRISLAGAQGKTALLFRDGTWYRPTQATPTTHILFDRAFADTEPGGWAKKVILRDHAKGRQEAHRAGKEPKSVQLQTIDFLLAVDDVSRVGALRFQDESGVFCRAAEPDRRT